MQTLKGHRGKIRSLSFSADGNLLASCSGRGRTISLWRLSKGTRSYLKGHDETVEQVHFAAQGNRLLSSTWHLGLIWSPDEAGTWTPLGPGIGLIAFVAGGREVAHLHWHSGPHEVSYLDPSTLQVVRPVQPCSPSRYCQMLAGSPTGLDLALATHDYRSMASDLSLFRPDQTPPFLQVNLRGYLYAMAFHPDGRSLAAGSAKSLQRFEVATSTELPPLKGHSRMVTGLAYMPDGRLLSCSTDGTVRMWDHDSAKCIDTRDWQMGPLTALTVAPDGMRAAVGSDQGEILIWDLD